MHLIDSQVITTTHRLPLVKVNTKGFKSKLKSSEGAFVGFSLNALTVKYHITLTTGGSQTVKTTFYTHYIP